MIRQMTMQELIECMEIVLEHYQARGYNLAAIMSPEHLKEKLDDIARREDDMKLKAMNTLNGPITKTLKAGDKYAWMKQRAEELVNELAELNQPLVVNDIQWKVNNELQDQEWKPYKHLREVRKIISGEWIRKLYFRHSRDKDTKKQSG